MFSSVGNEADPLGHLTQAFREYLVERALYSLVIPSYENDDVVGPNRGVNG